MNRFLGHKRALTVVTLMASAAILALCCRACLPAYDALYLEVGCVGDDSGPRSLQIEELLLDESAFPEGWRASEPSDPGYRLPAEQVYLVFYTYSDPDNPLRAGHELYRFWGGASCAAAGYRKESAVLFAPWQGWGPWMVPSELSYRSTLADRFQLRCCSLDTGGLLTCQAAAQYEEYVVVFSTQVIDEHPSQMTFTDLECILVAIDERMALYLGRDE